MMDRDREQKGRVSFKSWIVLLVTGEGGTKTGRRTAGKSVSKIYRVGGRDERNRDPALGREVGKKKRKRNPTTKGRGNERVSTTVCPQE